MATVKVDGKEIKARDLHPVIKLFDKARREYNKHYTEMGDWPYMCLCVGQVSKGSKSVDELELLEHIKESINNEIALTAFLHSVGIDYKVRENRNEHWKEFRRYLLWHYHGRRED